MSGTIKALIHMISMVLLREPIESMSIREFVMNFDKDYEAVAGENFNAFNKPTDILLVSGDLKTNPLNQTLSHGDQPFSIVESGSTGIVMMVVVVEAILVLALVNYV
ncbi:hypothetical protein BHYA_0145g00020 [Botrytis hyacinthi]|uniref:Uncharacterized protein n=1 Tax=Botrytis hyacinthi TaxID=278943 RepID=A0A4Z1GK39_9HELO|nr:hypothetical protein BHYA_0145g00020 [Botrytis hyacinthi]